MAKPKKLPPPSADVGNKQLADLETPGVKWNIVLQIGAALVALWVFAFLLVPYVGYWAWGPSVCSPSSVSGSPATSTT